MTCPGIPWWLRWQRICLQCWRFGFNPWVGTILWRREWLPTPVFLPGESHGQRSLVGCSPWGHKESDMTERLNTFTFRQDKGFRGAEWGSQGDVEELDGNGAVVGTSGEFQTGSRLRV